MVEYRCSSMLRRRQWVLAMRGMAAFLRRLPIYWAIYLIG